MSFETGIYLAIAIMVGGSALLGGLVAWSARCSSTSRQHEHQHSGN